MILAAILLLALLLFMLGRMFSGKAGKDSPGSSFAPDTGERKETEEESLPEAASGTEEENLPGTSPETEGEVPEGQGPDMTDTSEMIDDFSDACFIGASQIANLKKMSEMDKATIYGKVGLNINTVFSKKFIRLKNGSDGTVREALAENKFSRVYLLLGVNELGWPYMSVFKERYGEIVDEIKRLQPEAKIYVQSILPITKEKSDGDDIYNQANVEKFNQGIQEMCGEHGAVYLDVASALKNDAGYLPPGVSKDGVHLNHAYSIKWMNNLSKLTEQAGVN